MQAWSWLGLCVLAVWALKLVFQRFGFKLLYFVYRTRLGILLHRRNLKKCAKTGPHSYPTVFDRKDIQVHIVPMLDDNYGYVIVDSLTRTAAAVDPSDATAVLECAKKVGARITHVLVTHGHWDHAGGNQEMRDELGKDLIIVASREDKVICVNKVVDDDDEFWVGNLHINVIKAPCHTQDHIMFEVDTINADAAAARIAGGSVREPQFVLTNTPMRDDDADADPVEALLLAPEALDARPVNFLLRDVFTPSGCPKLLFTGDTIFVAGAGNFFEGTSKDMIHIIRRLLPLPGQALMFCGHEYSQRNLSFAKTIEPMNEDIHAKLEEVKQKREKRLPTVPSTWAEELSYNPYLRVAKGDIHDFRRYSTVEGLDVLNLRKQEFLREYE